MKTYNGHRSWNAWNVSLWIGNDEPLYRFALECIEKAKNELKRWTWQKQGNEATASRAAAHFVGDFGGIKTPDGATYNHLSVKLCLLGFIED